MIYASLINLIYLVVDIFLYTVGISIITFLIWAVLKIIILIEGNAASFTCKDFYKNIKYALIGELVVLLLCVVTIVISHIITHT